MGKLAVCVPTYNRAEMVEEMLLRCAEFYQKEELDVYFYDSSDNDNTQEVVSRYRTAYHNLYYRKLPPTIHSNIKVLNIYREFSESESYEYLWICQDHIQLTEEGVHLIKRACEKEFDLCVFDYWNVEHIGKKVYTDINPFFYDCAWIMTSYMATVIRVSFLADTEWEAIYKRYTISRRINHSHVALLFEQLSRKAEFKAAHIPVSPRHIRVSSYRESAYWKREIFPVWCEYWPDMVRALPACYRKKDEVIRKCGVNSGNLSRDAFVAYRKEKLYDFAIYQKYRKEWKILTDVPQLLLWLLAVAPSRLVGIFGAYGWKKEILKYRLRRFCRSHAAVYVYGCGFMGKKVSSLLGELQITCRGYIVSDLSNEKKYFNGLEVITYEEFFQKGLDAGIIIAMKKENAEQVIKEKKELRTYPLFLIYSYANALER